MGIRQGYSSHNNEMRPTYAAWASMIGRCYNPKYENYSNYGGRGIKVCDRWLGENGFSNFLKDMGARPSKNHSLDRYPNNDGYYELPNCRWATQLEQSRNRRTNVWYEHKGRTMVAYDWAKELGIDQGTITDKISNSGKSFSEIYHTLKNHPILSKEVVIKIFNSKEKNCETAIKFNVSKHIVSKIKNGLTWSDVTGKKYIPK